MRSASARALRLGLLLLVPASSVEAHQPVMDMAPRWQDGFGLQVRHEFRHSDEVLDGDREVSNPERRERTVHTTWLEGIYTFRREVRATFKLPWVEQQRDARVGDEVVEQKGSGVGDLILAAPLRKYWNLAESTMNVGFTPQLRVPTGDTSDDYPVGDGSWDVGLSASLSTENADWYTLFDAFWWINTPGKHGIDEGDVFGLDVNLGYHPFHDNRHNLGVFTMLDVELRHQERGRDTGGTTGGSRVGVGPVLVGYWNNWMLRGEVKVPVYERVFGVQLSRGVQYNLGLGAAF